MKNKVDIFTADYGHREPTKKDDHADEPDPSGRKLPQITDPIRGHERINVQNYLKMFLLFTSDMKLMFSDHPEKAHTSNFLRLLSWLVRGFLLLIFIRGVLLAFNDHDATAYYLGHKSENDAWKHITMITIVWSLYTFLIYNWAFISHRHQHRNLSWLEPFQVICGMKPAIEFGLSREMLDKLLKRSRYVFYTSLFFAFVRSFFGLFIFFFLYNYNFEYVDEQEMIGTIWIFILTFWIFFNSGAAYIISACYDILCYYFKIRFKKVNADIARLIDPNRPLEAKERHGLLFTILHEHNHLCQKIDEYNVFWSRYVLYTYFAVPFVSLYTLYQVIFVNHTSEAIIVMWVHFCNLWRFAYQSMMAFEAFVIFTKSSVSGSKMTFVAHKPYFELIRATFGEYPIDLRLQLRILIQRLSGPTISFYCSDLFEVSHKSYFHMVLGFGQNFFLLTDFITVQYMPWSQNATTTPMLEYTTPMIEDFSRLIE